MRLFKSETFSKSLKKCKKHNLTLAISNVKKLLKIDPEYGAAIPGHSKLRKVRATATNLNIGKRSGYRVIYRKTEIDDIIHLILLDVYFKGDKSDLSREEYSNLLIDSENIILSSEDVDWEET